MRGPWLSPYSFDALDWQHIAVPPQLANAHWLGTDYLGRDVLSRLMAGTRLSVVGAVEAVLIGAVLGVPSGLASAWLGPRLEWITLRISDTLVILPFTVFAIAVAGTLGNGLQQAMIAIGVLISPIFYRVTRAAALGLRRTARAAHRAHVDGCRG